MAMRSSTAPRRVYSRKGSPLVCFAGMYFGPSAKEESAIEAGKEVKIEVLDAVGGRKRIQVTARVGKGKVSENWTEKKVVFQPRS